MSRRKEDERQRLFLERLGKNDLLTHQAPFKSLVRHFNTWGQDLVVPIGAIARVEEALDEFSDFMGLGNAR